MKDKLVKLTYLGQNFTLFSRKTSINAREFFIWQLVKVLYKQCDDEMCIKYLRYIVNCQEKLVFIPDKSINKRGSHKMAALSRENLHDCI